MKRKEVLETSEQGGHIETDSGRRGFLAKTAAAVVAGVAGIVGLSGSASAEHTDTCWGHCWCEECSDGARVVCQNGDTCETWVAEPCGSIESCS